MSSAAETVLTFLESIGRRSEAELYLQLFRGLPKQSFAAISISGPLLDYACSSIVEQLRFLSELGLYTPLLLCLDPAPLPADGEDVLLKRLSAAGLRPATYQKFSGKMIGAVGADLQRERTPVVRFEQDLDERRRFELVSQMMRELQTRKLVILRREGGIAPSRRRWLELEPGHRLQVLSGGVSVVNLRTDFALLSSCRQVSDGDKHLLQRARDVLAPLPKQRHVSVASPFNLLKELFTVRGGGTLIKAGAAIERYDSYAEVDLARLRGLLEQSFGKRLVSDFFERAPLAVYLEQNYSGAAVLHPSSLGAYLTKFAVQPVARGEGIGQDLWQALSRDFPRLLWRARPDNPIVSWYASMADGLLRLPEWHIYWRGIGAREIPEVVSEALEKPVDLTEGPAPEGKGL